MTKKEKIKFAYLVTYVALLVLGMILLGIFAKTDGGMIILVTMIVLAAGGLIGFIILHNQITYYNCPYCKKDFKASLKDTIFGSEQGDKGKKVTCPHCHETNYCRINRDK